MGVKFKNNAESTLSLSISAGDVGLAVAYGEGTRFPAAGSGNYFYMTLQSEDGAYEIVKVTARSGDAMTIVRGQEGTSALAFAAGARTELRITNQGLLDKFAEDNLAVGSVSLDKLEDISTALLLGRRTAGTGPVETLTISQALDLLANTRGSLAYRGAAGWAGLGPGTAGQLLRSGGPGADPAWTTAIGLTDGDKGDIVVSSSGTVWTIDTAAILYAQIQNVSGQYRLLGRSSSGAGPMQEIASSANFFSLAGAADYAAMRTLLSLGSMSLQNSSAISVTGGTIEGITSFQGTLKIAPHTTGTLALADADCFVPMTGNCTLNGGIYSQPQAFVFWSGASSRTIVQGTSMTLRLGGSSTTGDRTLAAYTLAVGVVIDTNQIAISGVGVT